MITPNRDFTCASCKEEFECEWTEEEAIAEKEANFGSMPLCNMVRVCDDCYKDIMEYNDHPIKSS